MKKLFLIRYVTGDHGTFGELNLGSLFRCVTLELPWRKNIGNKSCIPDGLFIFGWRTDSPKHGECYEAESDDEAPGRSNIQIHSANLAGDVDKGFVSELLGCISLGKTVADFKGGVKPAGKKDQKGITRSATTVAEFNALMQRERFELEIQWAEGSNPDQ